MSGSVAEWSKALVLGTSLFGGVGSNPTAAKITFFFAVILMTKILRTGTEECKSNHRIKNRMLALVTKFLPERS